MSKITNFAIFFIVSLLSGNNAKAVQSFAPQNNPIPPSAFIAMYGPIAEYAHAFNQATTQESLKTVEERLVLAILEKFPEARFLTQDALVSPGSPFNKSNANLLQNRLKVSKGITFGEHAAEFERTMTSIINHAKNLALYQFIVAKSHPTLADYQAKLSSLGIVDRFTASEQAFGERLEFLKPIYADKASIGKVGYLALVNDLFKVVSLAQDFPGKEHDQAAVSAITGDKPCQYFQSLQNPQELQEIKLLLQANEFATMAQIGQGEAPALAIKGLLHILDRQDLLDITVMEQLLDIAGASAPVHGPSYMVIRPLEKSLYNLQATLQEQVKQSSKNKPELYQAIYQSFMEAKFSKALPAKDIVEARLMAMLRLEQQAPDQARQQLQALQKARASLTTAEQLQLAQLFDPNTPIMVMYAPDFMRIVHQAVREFEDATALDWVQGYEFVLQQMVQLGNAAAYLHKPNNTISVVNIKDAIEPAKKALINAIAAKKQGQKSYQEVLRQHNCLITSFSGGTLDLASFKAMLQAKDLEAIKDFIGHISNQPKLLATIQQTMYQADNPQIIHVLKGTRQPTKLFLGAGGGSDPLSAAAFVNKNPEAIQEMVGSSRHCPADINNLIHHAQANPIYLDNQNGIIILQGDGEVHDEKAVKEFHKTSKMETGLGIQPIPMVVLHRALNVFDPSTNSAASKLVDALAKYLTAYNITAVRSVDTGGDISGLGQLEAQNQHIGAIEGDIKHAVLMDAAIEKAHAVYGHTMHYAINIIGPAIDNQTTNQQQQAFIEKYQLAKTKPALDYFEALYKRTAKQAPSRTTKQISILGKFFAHMHAKQAKALKAYLKISHKKPKHLKGLAKSFGLTANQTREYQDFISIIQRLQLKNGGIMYQTQARRNAKTQAVDLALITSCITIDHNQLKAIIKDNYKTTYVRHVLAGYINLIHELEEQAGQEQALKQAYEDAVHYVVTVQNGLSELEDLAANHPTKAAKHIIQAAGQEAKNALEHSKKDTPAHPVHALTS